MNKDSLADRYFNIIKNKIKDEQTYLATIQRQYDKRGSSTPLIRQTL
jgi:transposase-like protein